MYLRCAIQEQAIAVADEAARLQAADAACAHGAQVSFAGTVRGGDGIESLFLEHYPGMTEQALEGLARDAGQRWPLSGVVLIHRVGWIRQGEVIVWVAVSSVHRRESFAACCYLADALKTDVPLWKKQRYQDGREEWIESRPDDYQARAAWMEENT